MRSISHSIIEINYTAASTMNMILRMSRKNPLKIWNFEKINSIHILDPNYSKEYPSNLASKNCSDQWEVVQRGIWSEKKSAAFFFYLDLPICRKMVVEVLASSLSLFLLFSEQSDLFQKVLIPFQVQEELQYLQEVNPRILRVASLLDLSQLVLLIEPLIKSVLFIFLLTNLYI